MMSRPNPPNGDIALSARRSVWRRHAGKTIPNVGRLESIVALADHGEQVPIFRGRGCFRFTLDGRLFRFGHLSDAEAVAAGWLLRGESFL